MRTQSPCSFRPPAHLCREPRRPRHAFRHRDVAAPRILGGSGSRWVAVLECAHQGTEDRIRAAALAEFVTNGYAATSMARIEPRRGVQRSSSTSSRKADLAAGVLVGGCATVRTRCSPRLTPQRADGDRGGVRALLAGVNRHAEMARFVFTVPPTRSLSCRARARGAQPVRAPYRDLAGDGICCATDPSRWCALWFGPSMELCRHWVRGRSRMTPTNAAQKLSAAAWRAVTGR